jgi:hypothetical protein
MFFFYQGKILALSFTPSSTQCSEYLILEPALLFLQGACPGAPGRLGLPPAFLYSVFVKGLEKIKKLPEDSLLVLD